MDDSPSPPLTCQLSELGQKRLDPEAAPVQRTPLMIENAQSPSRRRIVVAGLVGNVTEWYDFAVYGYFASVIGQQFFPADSPASR
jgi:hypothetical protein